MTKPKLLDLFCGVGGASVGYRRAGFEVWGIDNRRQRNYPNYHGPFILADALTLDPLFLAQFDAFHASCPCQKFTALRHAPGARPQAHKNLIPPTRAMLQATGKPYVIENVPGARAQLVDPVMLCGSMFGLGAAGHQLQRHRLFETNWPLAHPDCAHASPVIGLYGGHVRARGAEHGGRGTVDFPGHDRPALAREAMGIDWHATMAEMSQAIPPAYTEWVGRQLLAHLQQRREAA